MRYTISLAFLTITIFYSIILNVLFFMRLLYSNIAPFDKANNFKIILNTLEIIDEYNIWGNWKFKLNAPASSYILCIVLSLKNNALTT